MSNHFHILVEVPAPPPDRGRDWSDEDFLDHLSCLYSPQALAEIRWKLELYRDQKANAAADQYRDGFFARMWNLSEFMKGLKQTFSRWFNKVHDRHGTLWEERFKSVLAEDGHATRMIAAYVDLNPVRAGMVDDPKDYRWSSFGESMTGKRRAREGIQRVVLTDQETPSWGVAVKLYRKVLYASLHRGSAERDGEGQQPSEAEALGDFLRQFSDGLVVGLPAFVNRTFQLARDYFGPKRRDGARQMRGIQTELRAMRDLR